MGSTASRLEPLRGGSFLLTSKFSGMPGTQFIDLGKIKGWVDLRATQWFENGTLGLGIQCLNHEVIAPSTISSINLNVGPYSLLFISNGALSYLFKKEQALRMSLIFQSDRSLRLVYPPLRKITITTKFSAIKQKQLFAVVL